MYGKYCRWCKFYDGDTCLYKGIERIECNILHPSSIDFKDAARFEARVAHKLATMVAWAYDDGWDDRLNVREYKLPLLVDTLKWARLSVEAEMD